MATLLKVVRGSTTIANGSSSTSVTLTGGNILSDITKCIIFASGRIGNQSPTNFMWYYRIVNTTTIEFVRNGTTGVVTISYFIVEFSDNVVVQRGLANVNASTNFNQSITDVSSLSDTFCLLGGFLKPGTSFDGDDNPGMQLTSTTNLNIPRTASASETATVAWQVVKFTGATVQRGSISFGSTDASLSATISAVDLTKAFITIKYTTDGGTSANLAQDMYRSRFTSTTQITVDRDDTGSTATVYWEVVELPGVAVETFNLAFGTGDTTLSPNLSGDIRDTSIVFASGWFMKAGKGTYDATDDTTSHCVQIGFSAANVLAATRQSTQTSTADIVAFVINFSPPVSAIEVTLTGMSFGLDITNFTLTQQQLVTLSNMVFGLQAASITVTGIAQLNLVSIAFGLTAGTLTLTQQQLVNLVSVSLGLNFTDLTLTQQHLVTINAIALGLTTGTLTLTQEQLVTLSNIAIGLTVSGITLNQSQLVILSAIVLGISAGTITVTQEQLVSLVSVALGLDATDFTLTQQYLISLTNIMLGTNVTTFTLTQAQLVSLNSVLFGVEVGDVSASIGDVSVVLNALNFGLDVTDQIITQAQLVTITNTTFGTVLSVFTLTQEQLINLVSIAFGLDFASYSVDTGTLFATDNIRDVVLQWIRNNVNRVVVCSAEPANFADIVNIDLATALVGVLNFTGPVADGVDRLLTLDELLGIIVDTAGTTSVLVLHDNVSEYVTAPLNSVAVTADGNVINLDSLQIRSRHPVKA